MAAAYGAYRLRSHGIALLAALVLAFSIAPFILNGLARMFIFAIPFITLAIAKSIEGGSKNRMVITLSALCILCAGSYGYASAYASIREDYHPFWKMMGEDIGEDERVLMPFNIQECIYFTDRKCMRVGNTGGIPVPTMETMEEILEENEITYVCCTSLNYNAISDSDRLICNYAQGGEAEIEYRSGDVWGRCIRIG
jgi:hypothetical protein